MVSWQLSRWINTTLTLAALERALASWQPQPGWIHHSDRRVQRANSSYVARLEQIGARRSMAAKGIPYDNANAESCFETLK